MESPKIKAIVTNNNVHTYARPSTNALIVSHYEKGTKLTVYSIIKGWYELRPVDVDGIMNTEFIQEKDIELK